MIWKLLIVFFGMSTGSSIISGSDIAIETIGTFEQCQTAKAAIKKEVGAVNVQYAMACFPVAE
jgi:hypothetical protein